MAFDSQLNLEDRSLQARESILRCLKFHMQLSLKFHNFQKLSAKFFSLFKILTRIGVAAYALNLPKDSKIHPTLYVSQLKKKVGSHTASVTLPVVHSKTGHVLMVPGTIIDRRFIKEDGKPGAQLLVKWLNATEEDCTWEE
ncbi:uncharacterized protein LOC142176151 [Nicotiana tabacum]|uniref:Uncharacterized protein LOC142176151 n=1 Tax=Nicotiana tabacum TaxID=4097 RepID=A0AC58TQ45_TOBAC